MFSSSSRRPSVSASESSRHKHKYHRDRSNSKAALEAKRKLHEYNLLTSSKKKPYTAVSVHIEQLTNEGYEENDLSGLPDLIESIRIQSSGATEAARALRKKLKYGNTHKKLRALTLLDALVVNGSPGFQQRFADESLLERLRLLANDGLVDKEVREKLRGIFLSWHVAFKDNPNLYHLSNLHKQFPQRKRTRPTPPTVDSNSPPHSPVASSSRNWAGSGSASFGSSPPEKSSKKSSKSSHSRSGSSSKPFNLQKELPTLMDCLAKASIASTNLKNSLTHINREIQKPSDNQDCVRKYQEANNLRKQIVRFIANVESEQWLGSLIHANEELVDAILTFKSMDKAIEDDSDSDDWVDERLNERRRERGHSQSQPGISFEKGPSSKSNQDRFTDNEEEDDDEENPFGDRHSSGAW